MGHIGLRPIHRQGVHGEVIGADGEEIRLERDGVRGQGGAGGLDHRTQRR